jgi:ATP-dependent exoDNAse (exonuclease V) beta subunit
MRPQGGQCVSAAHRAIEASAGTGKTTWITRQAVELLQEGRARLDELLLVTYTERATGELKSRLRAALEKARDDAPTRRAPLQAALDSFDQAQVFTIHGFCTRALLDHPFETGFDFRPVLANDKDLLESCLRDLQRAGWPEKYSDRLPEVLKTVGYTDSAPERWERLILGVAEAYRPLCGHAIRPESSGFDRHHLAAETIRELQCRLSAHKQERGLISYEDMLTRMEAALDPDRNPRARLLLAALRERYKFAIVDEFQDTDPIQWRIFKRIFVQGECCQRLFVVGDPKQAIFGFRGADLHAYLQAVRELIRECDASAEHLKVNWRSCPDLLAPLNKLFGDKNAWFEGNEIAYAPVEPPTVDERIHLIMEDNSQRPGITLVDLREEDKLLPCRSVFARFIASEIRRLLPDGNTNPLLLIKKKEEAPRRLQASDICILVLRRSEARPIVNSLQMAGIPYSFYKQLGLWQSDEAEHLACLLRCLAQPEEQSSLRTALLTTFFRIRPKDLAALDVLGEDLPAVRLFGRWCSLSEQRRWGELFRSFLEDTGILFAGMNSPGYERRLANFRHLFGVLEQAAYGQGLDLVGMLNELNQRRRQFAGDEDRDVQPIETERSKVRIMTVHAAKGDEYPVVFVAGGFTRGQGSAWFSYRADSPERTLVFNLDRDDKRAKALHQAEETLQESRLMYVALTRAMFKLYLPQLKNASYRGWAGPLVKTVAAALESADLERMGHPFVERILPAASPPRSEGTDTVENSVPVEPQPRGAKHEVEDVPPVEPQHNWAAHEAEEASPVEPRLRGSPAQRVLGPAFTPGSDSGNAPLEPRSRGFSQSGLEPAGMIHQGSPEIVLPDPLFPTIDAPALRQRFIRVRSYSALRKPHLATADETAFADRPARDDDDESDALDEPGLLSGTVFGDLVHDTLEAIDFRAVAASSGTDELLAPGPVRSLLEEVFDRHGGSLPQALASAADRESGLVQVAHVVRNALHTPLTAVDARLCEIPREDRLHELEFFFPELVATAPAGQPEGFLMGFMDLVFRKANSYYLLDWKTNDLHGDYSPEALKRCMEESDYERQYRLYALGLCRWLEKRQSGFDFEKHFGGVYYLFVRGMNGRDESVGVFFRKPTRPELDIARITGKGTNRYPSRAGE